VQQVNKSNVEAQNNTPQASRYWIGVGILVLVLVVATVAIALSGGTPTLRARRTVPDNGGSASVNPLIQVYFARPVDKATVERAISVTPAFTYTLSWEENTLNLDPVASLLANTEYTVQIGPGVVDSDGAEMAGDLTWRFTTRQPRIAYLNVQEDNRAELWMVNTSGSDAQRLSTPDQSVQAYGVAPNGSSMVFTVEEGAGTVNLWRIDDGANGLHRLTNDPNVMYGSPTFSPSGELLAVEIRRLTQVGEVQQQSPPVIELRRPADGSPAGEVYGGQGDMAHSPRWAADGTRMAFYEPNQGSVGIHDFTTGETRFFLGENALLSTQTWSPDGRALVYTAVVVNDNGTAQQQIIYRDVDLGTPVYYGETVGDQADPAWHPNGELIAYAYKAPPGLESGNGIWTMLPTGDGKFPLVTAATIGVSEEAIFSYPIWSPDGNWLLFGVFDPAAPDAGQSIWIVQRDGSNVQKVVEEGYQPLWVP
jgi:Tol biopolymer transport system component